MLCNPTPGVIVINTEVYMYQVIFGVSLEEKEAEENKENVDASKDKESDTGKKKVEHEISEGNVATAAAAALASAATKAKVCCVQISVATDFQF